MPAGALVLGRHQLGVLPQRHLDSSELRGFITTVTLLSGFLTSCLKMFQGPRREIIFFFFLANLTLQVKHRSIARIGSGE